MTHLASWISPEVMRTLGWALLHFLWQGITLTAFASLSMAMCRSTSARYALGVATLVLMLAMPVATFTVLWQGRADAVSARGLHSISSLPAVIVQRAVNAVSANAHLVPISAPRSDALLWFVEAWFAGVIILSLRTAGGVLLIERMRRNDAKPVTDPVRELCVAVQRRLGLERAIHFCESRMLDAPAVIGWLRPAVLLPVTALTGLSDDQLRAVIAHELAHIRRFDTIVNVFQIVVETLLFYHPAVWWISKRVRLERENCCDDAAIAVGNDAMQYARALVLMAELRPAPALAMAANRGPLAARIARLLGAAHKRSSARNAGIAASFILLAGAVVAANGFFGIAQTAFGSALPAHTYHFNAAGPAATEALSPSSDAGPSRSTGSRAARVLHASIVESTQTSLSSMTSTIVRMTMAAFAHQDEASRQRTENSGTSANTSYIEGMKAAGLENLRPDQLIALKIQGVTPEYVRAMRNLGLGSDPEQLISLRVQGITPEYIRDMRAAGVNFDVEKLVGMKVQGITPEYVRAMHDLGISADGDELIGFKVQGVTPEYIKQMHELGIPSKADELIGMKVQGVTPEYIKRMRAAGLDVNADRAIGMRVQGLTPDYVNAMRDLGLKSSADELIGMRVQGVTPEYVRDMRAAGLNLNTDQLISLRVQGLTPEYVKALRATGLSDFKGDPDSYISAKVQGITPEFIAQAQKHGFKNLDLDKLIELKRAEIF
jgi:beta-lactamase regulating signal transducer with metallopeptidase domain